MKSIKYEIPATKEQSPYTLIGIESLMETARENALWQYNSARAHDGLPPVSNLPKGTVGTPIKEII